MGVDQRGRSIEAKIRRELATFDALCAEMGTACEAQDWDNLARLTKMHARQSRAIADLSTKLKLTPKSKKAATRMQPWDIRGKR